MNDTIVKVNGLDKSYGNHVALQNLELEIEKGEVFGLLGPNGSGKTTLFQAIMGQLTPTSGEIQVLGDDAYRDTYDVSKKVGFLPADIRFYDNLTARKNLEYPAELVDEEPDIDRLLELVNLEEEADKKVSGFSHGMQKRLGIAQTLIKDPELILFDEPTTGLDPERKEDFKDVIQRINREEDITVIVASHILHEIENICDNIGVLKDGKIQVTGTPEDIMDEADAETLEQAYLEITRGDFR